MTNKLSYESEAFHRIHEKAVTAKNECFFIGFLDGILANDRIDRAEVEPLLAECMAICEQSRDEDAAEIIEEANAGHSNTVQELLDLLRQIVEVRLEKIDPDCRRSSANRLLGFCAGVNCDGIVSTREASALYEKLNQDHDLARDPRIDALKHRLRDSLEDERIDPEESDDIGRLIAALVGDSYSDTGIPSSEAVPVTHDIDEIDPSILEGSSIVLTGSFAFGLRKQVAAKLEEYGAIIQSTPSSKTDIVIIGGEGSPFYTHKHHGGKLAKALELRRNGRAPRIYVELQLGEVLSPTPSI